MIPLGDYCGMCNAQDMRTVWSLVEQFDRLSRSSTTSSLVGHVCARPGLRSRRCPGVWGMLRMLGKRKFRTFL